MENTNSKLYTALLKKKDDLLISLNDFAVILHVSPAQLVLFFQNKRYAGYSLMHGILSAFPEEREWDGLIIDYLRSNGRKSNNC